MKKVILLFLLILLTGCSVEYELTINNDEFIEKISSYANIDTLDAPQEKHYGFTERRIYREISEMNYPLYYNDEYYDNSELGKQDKVKYYKFSLINNEQYGVTAQGFFDKNDFIRSNVVRECFKEIMMYKSGEYYVLNTNGNCAVFDKYPLIDSLTIKIKINDTVIYNNADFNQDGVYTWVLTRDNYKGKKVNLSYSKPETDKNTSEDSNEVNSSNAIEISEGEKRNFIYLIIGSFVILAGVIVGVIIYKKKH